MASLDQTVAEIVAILRSGGIILYPTDTVWGIGCDATNPEAVAKVYALKKSEDKKSMLVLCNNANMVVRYVNKAPGIAFDVLEMSEKPLTAILSGAVGVAPNLIPEEGTLGVRIPQHELCEKILYRFGRPIVSTSANLSGEATPLRFNEIDREIVEGVDYVVHPRFEGKPTRRPSSIIAFGEDSSIKVIRD
ncbi:MAG: L-threonylcarbamoyladenylate synthase [Rikenellaceae bacterium]